MFRRIYTSFRSQFDSTYRMGVTVGGGLIGAAATCHYMSLTSKSPDAKTTATVYGIASISGGWLGALVCACYEVTFPLLILGGAYAWCAEKRERESQMRTMKQFNELWQKRCQLSRSQVSSIWLDTHINIKPSK